MQFDLEKHTIFLTLHGSRAYGTNTPTSDTDYKGIAIPPKEYFLGYAFRFEQTEELVSKGHPHDRVIFDLRKFINLAADCNPNIIEVLHTDPNDHLLITPWAETLLEHKDLFLSKKARFTFAGYAHAQLKRIKTHRSWLLNPPKSKPLRTEFGLTDDRSKMVNASTMGAVDGLVEEGYSFGGDVMTAIQREKQYAAALQHWNQYLNWKETRNPARAELEAKYGFDSKHGMHLIRLMRMCVEILEGKGVLVKRPDAVELLEIRNGLWDYDRLVSEADCLELRANALYATSKLPERSPVAKLDALCVSLVENFLGSR